MKKYYQLKIQVKKIRPSIYRTIIVPENITFLKLHEYIQELFGLLDYHLWQFNQGSRFDSTLISLDDDDENDFIGYHTKTIDPNNTKINELLLHIKDKIEYWYDFGDDWLMNVEVQKIFTKQELPKKVDKIPFVLKGKGPMLLEDVGGPYLFPEFIELYTNLTNDVKLTTKKEKEYQEFAFAVIGEYAEDDDWKEHFICIISELYETDWVNFTLE